MNGKPMHYFRILNATSDAHSIHVCHRWCFLQLKSSRERKPRDIELIGAN